MASFLISSLAVAGSNELHIEHVTVVSPERSSAFTDAEVTLRDGRIAAIAKSPKVRRPSGTAIDGRGLYLIPGLIDGHVHLGSIPGMTAEQEQAHPDIVPSAREQIPRSFLLYGFTTLVDLDSAPDRMVLWKKHPLVPDTYFCGGAAVMDGYPMNWEPKPVRYQNYPYMVVQSQDQTAAVTEHIDAGQHTPEAVVARMKADGALCVKTFFQRFPGENLPVPTLATLQALVASAHQLHMPILLHATGPEGQALGLDAGVNIIAHGLWDWGGPDNAPSEFPPDVSSVLDRLVATRTGVQPTLQVARAFRDLFDPEYLSDPRLRRVYPPSLIDWYRTSEGQWFHDRTALWLLPKALQSTSDSAAKWRAVQLTYATTIMKANAAIINLSRPGGRLLFGTDTPAVPSYANPPGLNGRLEIQDLLDAGLTPAQIFRAATMANADALGLGQEVGTVQVGKRANLLLVRMDPRESVGAYDQIVKVILGGRVLDPGELAADRRH